jgi:hypothetical protein
MSLVESLLAAVFAGRLAQFPVEDVRHSYRLAEADRAGNLRQGPLALREFAFGPFDTHTADLGGNRSVEMLSETALKGPCP